MEKRHLGLQGEEVNVTQAHIHSTSHAHSFCAPPQATRGAGAHTHPGVANPTLALAWPRQAWRVSHANPSVTRQTIITL